MNVAFAVDGVKNFYDDDIGFWKYCAEVDRRLAGTCPLPARNRTTPRVTVLALMHAVRLRGVAALDEPANVVRLSRCDVAAKAKLNAFIEQQQKMEPIHGRSV
jgi:hypothetical protein